jgi:MFS superfamily sulfate permease-like transporter
MTHTDPMPERPVLADLMAGIAMAGLLLPEAVAYSSIAGLPPSAGLVGLLAGLVCYGLVGRSRFAIVASTSSSAAVVGAATLSLAGPDPQQRIALAAGLVLLTGIAFALAAAARLGSISNFISKPVLRGFGFGLAVSIIVRQWIKVTGVHPAADATLPLAWDLIGQVGHWNPAGVATGVLALLSLRALVRVRRLPAALIVIGVGIGAGRWFDLPALGVALVGPIELTTAQPTWPGLTQDQWFRVGELALALLLLLFAESYGSIRGMAIRHGDAVWPNRDLAALGLANLVSGLFQGTPVGAGYSATVANEAAGAATRRAGGAAALVVVALVLSVLPLIERTPEPVLAAIVMSALAHALSLDAFRPYFRWRRDRVVVVASALAVVVLGVLDGLLIGIAVSLAMTLRDLSSPPLNELGRLGSGHDFLNLSTHVDARPVPGLLILRPEAALFFANVDGLLAQVGRRIEAQRPSAVVLSLEETPDLDGTAVEALQEFAAGLAARRIRLVLARVKDPVAAVLTMAADHRALDDSALETGSVDDAVRRLIAEDATQAVAAPP